MKLAALAPVIALGLAVPALGAEQPRLRVTIEHRGAILVGQSVRMDVTVLVPNFFMSAPQFPIFEIPGAVVTMPDESAVNLNEQIDGVTYAGIQRSYVIVPQQEGDFTLPPEKITFQYAAVPGKPTPGVVTLPPRKFSAKLPVGAKTEEGAIPVARVSVKQTLDRGVQRLHVGDAITRRLDIFASHTQAVMIPPPSFEAPPGVRVYHKDPQLSDVTAERGEFVGGRRVDVATYVFNQPGTYVLPEIDRAGTTRFRPRRDGARSADRDFGGPQSGYSARNCAGGCARRGSA